MQRDELLEIGAVIVYTGSGKGKTTAALGLALRVLGYGRKVVIIFFTGPEHPQMGDVRATAALGGNLRMLGIESQAKDRRYLAEFTEFTGTVKEAQALARELLTCGECDLLVLDDINLLLHQGAIDVSEVVALINEKPPNVCLVLTGRFAPQIILDKADTVTEFVQIKHPSQVGIGPRKGFDF